MKRCADRQHANENTTFNQKRSATVTEVLRIQSPEIVQFYFEPCQHVKVFGGFEREDVLKK